jgi:hypothetical protein
MRISVAISIYNDFDFLVDAIERVYELADEIVILDGPFDYCVPLLKYFDLYYMEAPEPLRRIIQLPKVRYRYGSFENERVKRIALYEMCRFDLVMLLDADELVVDFNRDELEKFWQSEKEVACASFKNLVRSNCLIGLPTQKFIFFKRKNISPAEHLNYTWLVGVEQQEPRQELMYPQPLMDVAHLTLMRSVHSNLVKYCFYSRLYYYSRKMYDQLDKIFGLPFASIGDKGLDAEAMKAIFRRSTPALINFPEQDGLVKITLPTIGKKLEAFDQRHYLTADETVQVLNSIESYHYISVPAHLRAGDTVHFSFTAQNLHKIELEARVHTYSTCHRLSISPTRDPSGAVHGQFALPSDAARLFGVILGFKTTCGGQGAGLISDFKIKKRFGIYGNCQMESLRDFLLTNQAFRREYVAEETPGRLVHMMSEEDARQFAKDIYRIDLLVTQPVNSGFRDSDAFGTDLMLASLRPEARAVVFPNMFFTGYAPDSYCVTYRKKFLRDPMPIHDVNFVHSYLKHDGARGLVRQDYEAKLNSPTFYRNEWLQEHIEKDLRELETRESEARIKIRRDNTFFYPYSKFVRRWLSQTLLHYSDAHPTEFVFRRIANEILEDLGIEPNGESPELSEKGVLPFYKSIGTHLGLDLQSHPIYLNNRQIKFDEYFERYCSAYDKMDRNSLFGYIERNVTKVIVTNHKTGTLLMEGILREYCTAQNLRFFQLNQHLSKNNDCVDPAFNCQVYDFIQVTHAQHFERLIDAVPSLRYRALHLIRNPYEIIMSGVRYHQVTQEGWCNKKIFVRDVKGPCGYLRIANYNCSKEDEAGEYSYREIMSSLSPTDKIAFEIKYHATTFGTIPSIAHFLRRFANDKNVMSVQLESIGTDKCIDEVFEFLALDRSFLDQYAQKVKTKEWLGKHVTNQDGADTHKRAFNGELYALFDQEFGSSVMPLFGYAKEPQDIGSSTARLA